MKYAAQVSRVLLALAISMANKGIAVADVITYYHTDLSGSPVAGSDVNGNIVWREAYTPYGERRLEQPSSGGNRRWFTGQPHEEFSGLTYMGARHYDPMIGRFMSVDPVRPNPSNQFGFNLYAYADNDPVDKGDPMGKDAVWFVDKNTGKTTLIIPVNITGTGATKANVSAIVNRDNSLRTEGSPVTIYVMATSQPVEGVLNHMDFSPGYNRSMCGDAGECVNKLGGNEAHINSANGQSTDAAAHDILHFAGIDDQYKEGPRDQDGNRTSAPKPGYDNSNIMTSRSGTNLKPSQIQEAVSNKSTKQCTVSTGAAACH